MWNCRLILSVSTGSGLKLRFPIAESQDKDCTGSGLKLRFPIAESQDKDWFVGIWVEDLHSHFGWMRVWKHAAFLIDFGVSCLILSCSLWEVQPTFWLSQWQENYITLLKGRKCIFLVYRTQFFGGNINNTWFQSSEACFDYGFYLFFIVQ